MKVREIRVVCDKGDNENAERAYIALPEGRYPVDLCDKHMKELRSWVPAGSKPTARKAPRVTTPEEVESKKRRRTTKA